MGAFKNHESAAPAPKKSKWNGLGWNPSISNFFKIPPEDSNILELKTAMIFEAS